MEERQGKLIALEGIDASGKTTQTELLRERLQSSGFRAETISFPRYGQGIFADLVQRYLRGEFATDVGGVNGYLAALPFACDRWQATPQLIEWLEQGAVVLCNRYVPANQAHQGAKFASKAEREEFCAWVENLEYGAFGIPQPDLCFLFDIPAEVAVSMAMRRNMENASRAKGRRKKADVHMLQLPLPSFEGHDIHEADLAYLAATAEAYRQVAAETPGPWAIVQCTEGGRLLPKERIAELVWAEARKVLYNP